MPVHATACRNVQCRPMEQAKARTSTILGNRASIGRSLGPSDRLSSHRREQCKQPLGQATGYPIWLHFLTPVLSLTCLWTAGGAGELQMRTWLPAAAHGDLKRPSNRDSAFGV